MTLYSGGQSVSGKRASSLAGSDIKVLSDGSVTGTLKKVTGYTGFSEEVNDGYFFPFKLTQPGTTMTLKLNGVAYEGKENIPFSESVVLFVSDRNDTWTIEVDGSPVITLNFKNVTFA